MKTFHPGDKVRVLRDIFRWDGPQLTPEIKRFQILYAAEGTEGVVLKLIKSSCQNTYQGYNWNVQVLIDGKCLTFRLTSIEKI